MFLLEGLPATILGIIAWFYLDDRPANASWRNEQPRAILTRRIDAERSIKPGVEHTGIGKVFGDSRAWIMAFIYFAYLCGSYTLAFWLPIMIKDLGVADLKQIGILAALPSVVACVPVRLLREQTPIKKLSISGQVVGRRNVSS